MATNYSDKEREFLESLEDDTGRDLAAWMVAIKAQNLEHRNDIIDWLRHQGFMFSRASWLERIHHNGGRPIYLDAGPVKLQIPRGARSEASPTSQATQAPGTAARAPDPEPEIVFTPPPARDTGASTAAAPTATSVPGPDRGRAERPATEPSVPPPDEDDPAALDDLIARAKAYRPLAQLVLAEITRAVPAAVPRPKGSHVVITAQHAFAALGIGPKELRLALDLGPHPFDETVKPAKFAGTPPPNSQFLTHMVVLTDARQVSQALLGLVKEAAARKS